MRGGTRLHALKRLATFVLQKKFALRTLGGTCHCWTSHLALSDCAQLNALGAVLDGSIPPKEGVRNTVSPSPHH